MLWWQHYDDVIIRFAKNKKITDVIRKQIKTAMLPINSTRKASYVFDEMKPVYGGNCFERSAVEIWLKQFSSSNEKVRESANEKKPGWRVSTTPNDVVAKVDAFKRSDRRAFIIGIYSEISRVSAHKVVREQFTVSEGFSQVSVRCVLRQLIPEQQREGQRISARLETALIYIARRMKVMRCWRGSLLVTLVHHHQSESRQRQSSGSIKIVEFIPHLHC